MSKELRVCHLYGNLLNTYGDNGNLLMLKYLAEQNGLLSILKSSAFMSLLIQLNMIWYFFGGGQDFEQLIVSQDIQSKKEALTQFIEDDGVILAICGGFQLLGHYYIGADGQKIKGISALDHYTLSQENSRYIGDIVIHNEEFNETYYGFENHNGRTFLGEGERPLGKVLEGKGNNAEDGSEGVIYKNVFGSYFHGPILSRNENLGMRLINTALERKYGEKMQTECV